MAEYAVREALATAEKVIIELYKVFKCPTLLHDDVERAQTFLKMVHACLLDSEDIINEGSEMIRRCVDLAYRIENVLDEFLLQLLSDDVPTNKTFHRTDAEVPDDVQTNRSSHNSDEVQTNETCRNSDSKLAKFMGDWEAGRNCMSTNINKIVDNNIDFVTDLLNSMRKDISEGSSRSRLGDSLTLSYGKLAEGDEVVGFKKHKEELFKQLKDEDPKLRTVLVTGPGGSGKSTLVKNVYQSDQVHRLFGCKAWVTVPRGPFQLKEVLLKTLHDCEKNTPASEETIDPKAKLRHLLQKSRCLVVLDDVWRRDDLQRIVKACPDGMPGSRIIITTRNSDVASSLSPKYSLDLSSGLSREKARDLLFKKGFYEVEGFLPPESESDKILSWCGCLPYAVSAVGSLLASMKPQTAEKWSKFQSHLRSAVRPGCSLSIISSTLQPSYVDLPNHLKTCFLYLSAFPDDHPIKPQTLIHLWVAEGFVKKKRGMTEEQVAEKYLDELIARSLVLPTEREIDGKVRSCGVVTHVRDFILSKPENLITVFEPNNLFDHEAYRTPGEQIRRLSIHQADQSDNCLLKRLINKDDLKHIRTLLVFTKSECFDGLNKLVEANKYLRVLDLSEVVYGDFYLKFDDSILLKHLNLQGFKLVRDVSVSIRKLQFLETLNLQSTCVQALPKEICQLSSLRHLLVSTDRSGGVKFTAPNIGILSSIQRLSLIDVENDAMTIQGLGELQELRKLELVELETKDGKELCIGLEKMKHLSTLVVTAVLGEPLDLDHISCPPLYLQHLYLKGRLQQLPKWISKLTSLQKVELHGSHLDVNPTELLEDLPNLIELHLEGYYTGEELLFRAADKFKKLMKLSIAFLGELNKMEFADGALPMLRELNMSKCPNFKSLPKGIGGLKSLNELVLENMPDEFVAMLRKGSEHHQMVEHIPVILCTRYGEPEDLSENVSSTSIIQESRPAGRGGKVNDSDGIWPFIDDFETSRGRDGISDHDEESPPWFLVLFLCFHIFVLISFLFRSEEIIITQSKSFVFREIRSLYWV